MDPITQQIALASAGASLGDPVYVDDVFSTHLYEGNGATQTITNGIDLSGEGGLVWLKSRTNGATHKLVDTARGVQPILKTNSTDAATSDPDVVTAFNSDGFNLGDDTSTNFNGADHVSWTFRKAPGFFDVVTYTGDGSSNRSISHSLGSTPGFIIVKRTSSTEDWGCWHNSFSAGERILLNTTAAKGSASGFPAVPTSTTFSVGGTITTNGNGDSYVAYLFAHDDQSFGTNSDEAIIKCGSVTTGSDEYATVNLGFEPQFVMFKRTDTSGDWLMLDTMRGWNLGNDDQRLYANLNQAENTTSSGHGEVNSTGFRIYNLGGSADLIYIAIRRPHKPPETGTDVLDIIARSGTGSTTVVSGNVEPVDFVITKSRNTTNAPVALTRLLGNYGLETHATTAATTNVLGTSINPWDIQDGIRFTGDGDTNGGAAFNYINYFFKRAPGFFDVVAFEGDGSWNPRNHNLGVTPELVIQKTREYAEDWNVISTGKIQYLNKTQAASNSSISNNHSSTVFGVNTDSSSDSYICYLFATLSGISKVGTYSGTGSNINVDCGFTAGARFVLIKRQDSTGNWTLWDATRGITSGNDPFLRLNSTSSEFTGTDFIDPYNLGFTITSSAPAAINASGGTYLFLAIA